MLSDVMMEKLRKALNPESVAIVGTSVDQVYVGIGPVYNLVSSFYRGKIFPVNPKYKNVIGIKCYPDLRSISEPLDLVIILLNQHAAMDILEEAGKLGANGAVIVAGGFKEVDEDGKALEERLQKISAKYEIPVIGPNTHGFS
ncbi:MAG: CoA-binding protein, partial [Deltaproteobacteria bacterium]